MNAHSPITRDRLADIPTSRLVNDHAAACRWLDLPFADRWPEQKAANEALIATYWREITRRRGQYSSPVKEGE